MERSFAVAALHVESGRLRERRGKNERFQRAPKTAQGRPRPPKTAQDRHVAVLDQRLEILGFRAKGTQDRQLYVPRCLNGQLCALRRRELSTCARERLIAARRLFLPQHEVHDPAPAHVRRVGIAAVRKDVVVIAPGVLKRVGEDRHRAELA
jgi:hypothetical protein